MAGLSYHSLRKWSCHSKLNYWVIGVTKTKVWKYIQPRSSAPRIQGQSQTPLWVRLIQGLWCQALYGHKDLPWHRSPLPPVSPATCGECPTGSGPIHLLLPLLLPLPELLSGLFSPSFRSLLRMPPYSGPSTSNLTRNCPPPPPLNRLSDQLVSTSHWAMRHESNTPTHSRGHSAQRFLLVKSPEEPSGTQWFSIPTAHQSHWAGFLKHWCLGLSQTTDSQFRDRRDVVGQTGGPRVIGVPGEPVCSRQGFPWLHWPQALRGFLHTWPQPAK